MYYIIYSMPKMAQPFSCIDDREFTSLNMETNLSRKMFMLADMLTLKAQDKHNREKIVNDLINMLRPFYPECDVLIFGSSANGFGFRDCDLDLLFLPYPDYCNIHCKDIENVRYFTPADVLSGWVSKEDLYSMSEGMHLNFVRRIMKKSIRRYFKSVIFIPAKCPILKISFNKIPFRDIQCDFSASNRLVLYNTQLLSLYGKLDHRVKPLVMFLRLWAKSLGFISKSMLSSYGFTLLVIFYLQNTRPAVLPSVKYLNELADYTRIIDGWETAICNESQYIKLADENSKNVGDLLMDFFDFYFEFDFVQNIVSVYEGVPLPVKMVEHSDDERIRTFDATPFSIQDPFILSRNVSRNTTMKAPFKLSLLVAKDLLRQRDFNLKLLFNQSYYQVEMNSMFAPTKRFFPSGSKLFLVLQLTYEIFTRLEMNSELNPWFNKVSVGLLEVLQYGLLLDCDIVDKGIVDDGSIDPPPAKKLKSKVFDIGYLKLISIQCVVPFPTLWENHRNQVLEDWRKTNPSFEADDASSDIEIPASLRTEYKISKELSKQKTLSEDGSHFTFLCHCFQYPESHLSDIVISFCPVTNHKFFNETKPFLKKFIQQHMKCILEKD